MLSKYLKPFHVENNNLIRIGPKCDGGYVIDKRIINFTKKIITCGLNDDWEFEKYFIKIKPDCEIIAYDHTVNKEFWVKRFKKDIINFFLFKKLSYKKIVNIFKYIDYIFFFRGKIVHHKLKTGLQNIPNKEINLSKILHNNENLILKIDIEGDEYKILNTIIENSKKINCLLVEFHFINKNINLIEKFIVNNTNLKLIHVHGNNYADNNNGGDPSIIELTFVNINKINLELTKTNKSYPIYKIDYKNHPKKDDFILRFKD